MENFIFWLIIYLAGLSIILIANNALGKMNKQIDEDAAKNLKKELCKEEASV